MICGDCDFWVISAVQNIAHVKPTKPRAETNLILYTNSLQDNARVDAALRTHGSRVASSACPRRLTILRRCTARNWWRPFNARVASRRRGWTCVRLQYAADTSRKRSTRVSRSGTRSAGVGLHGPSVLVPPTA